MSIFCILACMLCFTCSFLTWDILLQVLRSKYWSTSVWNPYMVSGNTDTKMEGITSPPTINWDAENLMLSGQNLKIIEDWFLEVHGLGKVRKCTVPIYKFGLEEKDKIYSRHSILLVRNKSNSKFLK